jgi:hypothetical protein
MRFSLVVASFLISLSAGTASTGFAVLGAAGEGWKPLLRSIGFVETSPEAARMVAVGRDAKAEDWLAKIDNGAVVLLDGDSPLARALGFLPGRGAVRVSRVRDARDPGLRIRWKEPLEVPVVRAPAAARIFATDTSRRVPLMAAVTRGRGVALWLAVPPGGEGYERFPYLPQALADLGVQPRFQARRLWAFFDPAFRLRANAETLAAGWRSAGIAAVHVGVWDHFESDPDQDRYLSDLIAACHRHAILVYAWLELPHVSDRFCADHPKWRERTARLKDARVDWRLLMNLADPACRAAVVRGVRGLLARFDWDGVNLAELYFDGIEGLANQAEFTPMNGGMRREFQALKGFDPLELFRGRRDPLRLRTFLDYRADLVAGLQEQWIEELAGIGGLDVVLTHVDDRFDTTMHDALGADAERLLRLLDRHSMSFIIEDPATVWRLGPKRYAEIARRYAPLTSHQDRLGVDINVVDRGGRAYPTEKQTGAELLELIHTASESFARVAFYSEFTVLEEDLPFLAAASAVVTRAEERDGRLTVESPRGAGVRWNGPALVDGQPWPVQDGAVVWLPPGGHVLEPAAMPPPAAVLDFSGDLESARLTPEGIELAYHSGSRALAVLNRKPVGLTVDGRDVPLDLLPAGPEGHVVRLPSGAHRARIR